MPRFTDALDLQLDRRRFLSLGGLIAAGAGLAACGSSSKTSSPAAAPTSSASLAASGGTSAASSGAVAPGSLGELDYQLSWIKNVEFAGTYIADNKGYFTQAGFSKVNLIGGGPAATAAETVITTGKALVATTSTDAAAAAISKGAPIIIIGAQYQKNPFAIMSLAETPINTPQDMIGKSIGVQADNESIWAAFLKANNLDASKINKVPVQFDPLPLAQKKVDGWFSFITNEPIDLGEKGYKTTTFLLADYNYPQVGNAYIAKTADVMGKRDALKGFFKGEILGWKDALATPAEGAMLTTGTYGKGLGLDTAEQALEAAAENKLITSTDTMANGIFTVSSELQAGSIKSLGFGGITITADKLYDMSLLTELYTENPSLKA